MVNNHGVRKSPKWDDPPIFGLPLFPYSSPPLNGGPFRPSCSWCFATCQKTTGPPCGKLAQPKTESRIYANKAAVRETFVWEMYWKPWKSMTRQRMVLRMIHVKDSLLPMV